MGNKLNVAIIFGGKSGEHEVSLMSATNVINAMDKQKYDVFMIGITKDGVWMQYDGPVECIQDGSWEKHAKGSVGNPLLDLFFTSMLNNSGKSSIDVVFPVLHGPYGEDGTIQGLFEVLDIPYVGCGVMGSALGMDKEFSKILFKAAGIPVGPYKVYYKHNINGNVQAVVKDIEQSFEYPIFIKPVNMGSSVGITKAHDRSELVMGLIEACKYDRKVIIEAFINARELECSVLGNNEPEAACVGEIIPSHEFYDYVAKYYDGDNSKLVIPAQLPEDKSEEIRALAVKAFKAIDCCGMARVDMFMDKDTGEIFLNEINTIPGFTKISMYPKLWEAAGVSYSELIDRLIELAIERYNERK
ncbi:MAG: D-alanine--D-alanine ligase family protein [Bacillota bacterium]